MVLSNVGTDLPNYRESPPEDTVLPRHSMRISNVTYLNNNVDDQLDATITIY